VSFSLAIADGDILLKGSQMGIVTGVDKIYQDLSIWLRERFRCDRFHLTYGSILDNFIGGIITQSSGAEVRSEVMRVLQNYQSLQAKIVRTNPSLLSADEILLTVDDIQVRTTFDTVSVLIRFTTAKGTAGQTAVGVGV